MNFGQALEALKEGKSVQRQGWNGKGMHVYLQEGYAATIHGKVKAIEGTLCMYTAQGTHQPGWLASQADMLAEDWTTIEVRS